MTRYGVHGHVMQATWWNYQMLSLCCTSEARDGSQAQEKESLVAGLSIRRSYEKNITLVGQIKANIHLPDD